MNVHAKKLDSRRGSIALIALLVLPLLLLAGMLVLSTARLRQIETELRAATELSALAASTVLANETQLDPSGATLPPVLAEATTTADDVWTANSVVGYTINTGVDPIARATLTLGRYDATASPRFTPYDPLGPGSTWNVNAARVEGEFDALRTIKTTSIAVVDREVYGFTPLYGQPIPLMPFAIDQSEWTPSPTVTIRIRLHPGLGVGPTSSTASILAIGATTANDYAEQIAFGLTAAQLAAIGLPQGVVVGANNEVLVPGERTIANALPSAIVNALLDQTEVRVWPLASNVVGNTVTIVDFVAARIVSVTTQAIGLGPNNQMLVIELQPSVLATPTAVTLRPSVATTMPLNRYLGRVRIVE
jgi:Putative Flp pilus-assembly TadE/G-like